MKFATKLIWQEYVLRCPVEVVRFR